MGGWGNSPPPDIRHCEIVMKSVYIDGTAGICQKYTILIAGRILTASASENDRTEFSMTKYKHYEAREGTANK